MCIIFSIWFTLDFFICRLYNSGVISCVIFVYDPYPADCLIHHDLLAANELKYAKSYLFTLVTWKM